VVGYVANGPVTLLDRVAGNVADTAHNRGHGSQDGRKNPSGGLAAAGSSRLGSTTSGVLS
jgi:hypothetical protein